jgi:hypothetical protein
VRALKTYTCDKKNRIHPPGKFMLGTKMVEEKSWATECDRRLAPELRR